jgi:phosphoserine phosphatase
LALTPAHESVLCVDLDGSLVATDLLAESLLLLLKRNPLYVVMFPAWLLGGRAHFKREVARRVQLDAAVLPYHPAVLAWLREEHGRGRAIALATASDQLLAARVSQHLGLFGDVHASDGGINLKGPAKAACLVDRYGRRGFAYVGNASADLAVWRDADSAVIVGGREALAAQVAAGTPVVRRFDSVARDPARALLRGMRPHQWAKNFLIFVPLVTAHQLDNLAAAGAAVRAFAAMCLASAAVYVVNDLLDLAA